MNFWLKSTLAIHGSNKPISGTHKRGYQYWVPEELLEIEQGLRRDIHPSQMVESVQSKHLRVKRWFNRLTFIGRVNSYGFIETPFYKVKDGKVLQDSFPIYLDATTEDKYV